MGNPLAGLAVLAGERVLRRPLEQFSSAKYAISGTLEDPQVDFVSIFDTSMRDPDEVEGPTETTTLELKEVSSRDEPEESGNVDSTEKLPNE